MKRILALVLAAMMLLSMAACAASTPAAAEAAADTNTEAVTGVEDGVLTVGMECAYAPYNWTQMDDSNGAVPISNVPGAYANGYDVMIAQKICEANGWQRSSPPHGIPSARLCSPARWTRTLPVSP